VVYVTWRLIVNLSQFHGSFNSLGAILLLAKAWHGFVYERRANTVSIHIIGIIVCW